MPPLGRLPPCPQFVSSGAQRPIPNIGHDIKRQAFELMIVSSCRCGEKRAPADLPAPRRRAVRRWYHAERSAIYALQVTPV
jgi:hypothetical protein